MQQLILLMLIAAARCFTAVEVGVPKLGNCLEMYTCTQASAQFVHSVCTSLNTACTLEYCLAIGGVYMLGHRLGHMCTFPSSFQAWALQLYSSA